MFPSPFLCTIFSSFVVGIPGYQVPKLLIEITRLPRWTFKLQTIYLKTICSVILYRRIYPINLFCLCYLSISSVSLSPFCLIDFTVRVTCKQTGIIVIVEFSAKRGKSLKWRKKESGKIFGLPKVQDEHGPVLNCESSSFCWN